MKNRFRLTIVLIAGCVAAMYYPAPAHADVSSGAPTTASVSFFHVIVDNQGPPNPWAKILADIDGDGLTDIIIGGQKGPLVWYKSPDWSERRICEGGYKTVDGEAGDIDGDGDLDIVMGGILWYENPGIPKVIDQTDWKAHRIAEHETHDVEVGDLDADGDLDIVTRNQSDFGRKAGNRIHIWIQRTSDQWKEQVIECPHGEGISLADIDRDGDLDIVIGALWFENKGDLPDGQWLRHEYGAWHPNATVQVADINGDGRPDIVLSPSELKGQFYKLSWFQAPHDATQNNWEEHVLVDPIECVIHGLQTADMNNDGDVDIVYSEMHQGEDPDEIIVLFNQGRGASWTKHVISEKGSHYVQVGDIDADGDNDVAGANWSSDYQPVELWLNRTSD